MTIAELVREQRAFFDSGATLDTNFRRESLENFYSALKKAEDRVGQALREDLNRPEVESYSTETGLILAETRRMAKRLKCWSRRRFKGVELFNLPALNFVYPEPLGLALIMAPWNYPFQLSLLPMVSAIAAGNCVLVKPSRRAPASAALMEELVSRCFDKRHVALVTNTGDDYQSLLQERFDFIMYTGSINGGRQVLKAAAEHLTPVCLELGGKSPAIVCADANLDLAAKRIAWGKVLNAGQTCVAPDYLLAENSIKMELEEKIRGWFKVFAGENPLQNPDYGKIISASAFERLVKLAGAGPDAENLSENERSVPHLFDPQSRKIAPQVVTNATPEHPLMQEEIFGPLLPSLGFNRLEEAITFVNSHPKPLACYIFTRNNKNAARLLKHIPFGGGCVNDVIMHVASHRLPFGGVGASGMGRYHGKSGFDLFSNLKGVVCQNSRTDMPLRYPPENKKHFSLIKKFLK